MDLNFSVESFLKIWISLGLGGMFCSSSDSADSVMLDVSSLTSTESAPHIKCYLISQIKWEKNGLFQNETFSS